MLFPTIRQSLFVAVPALTAVLAVSCGGSDTSNVNGGPGSGANTGKGGSISIGTGGNGTLPGTGGGVMTITKDQACADSSAAADAIPAVVEMVVDTSGSMDWAPGTEMNPPRGGMSKWDITSVALKDAVTKLPATVAVGVNFYPNTRSDMPCIQNRVALPIALLGAANSNQRRNFNRAIDGANPEGGTPTHAAFLFGSDTVAKSMVTGQKFVLLITDGVPTRPLDCSGDGKSAIDSAPLIAAVGDAFKSPENIKTFVIGSPGSEDARGDLSKMATAGGTATPGCSDAGPNYCHLDMTTAKDFAAALADGLAAIAGQISTCEYAVPPAPNGKTINPNQVNVLYTKGDGSQASIGQDATGKCTGGWVYDNAQNPTKITLCGADCDAVKADQGAKIDLIFGCDTETTVPVK
ncbi:MAG: vWA domain-containing protein [Myxococcales bacterium]